MKKQRAIKNVSASVRQRLYNRAHELGESFNLVIPRYAVERLLYRLSQSPYAKEFVLKGAQLFYLWTESPHRTTRDLDLLRYGAVAIPELENIFRNICQQPVEPPDGIMFLPDTVRGEQIREQAEYIGVRIRFAYRLGEIKGVLQVDVGFGDAVTPAPKLVEFPSLLDFPTPRLKAYSREAMIAEKFHALVTLGITNTRMKDFFDISTLASTFHFDGETLCRAIAATFKRRKTVVPTTVPVALTAQFAEDAIKQKQWQGFLNKNRLQPSHADFGAVIETIRKFLMPPTLSLVEKQTFKKIWTPGVGWRTEK
ncbi:MAG: nucleotidyl transferase AbiEii/AbiGii toxin family protein [bacterium]